MVTASTYETHFLNAGKHSKEMLRQLPRELREELWKFAHYIAYDKVIDMDRIAYVISCLSAPETNHYTVTASLPIRVDTPPLTPSWIMGYFEYYERRILYYSHDGTAVYIDYHSGPTVKLRHHASMSTYRSKRIQDLFMHIDHIERLIPNHDVWCDLL